MSAAPALLVVDDNEDNRYTLTRRLKRQGYENVAIATNGLEALEILVVVEHAALGKHECVLALGHYDAQRDEQTGLESRTRGHADLDAHGPGGAVDRRLDE